MAPKLPKIFCDTKKCGKEFEDGTGRIYGDIDDDGDTAFHFFHGELNQLFFFTRGENTGFAKGPAQDDAVYTGFFLVIDLLFLSANIIKIVDGGWVPLLIGVVMFTLMMTWRDGRHLLSERLRSDAIELRPFLDVDTVDEAEDLINFIRGEEVEGHRDRNVTINGTEYVWKLGDIVYSTPTVVGKPMEMYNLYYSDVSYSEYYNLWKNRGITVYVGANDGMLHAFKAGTFYEGDNPETLD